MAKRWVVAAALVLAACGARAPLVQVAAPAGEQAFGDARPVDWPGLAPGDLPVHGIDVARYQGAIDWDAARAAGVSFAFIKATEGGDLLDAGFRARWDAAGAAGIARGAYHFYYFCTPPEVQARWFIANVPRERGALPPVLDLEWNPQSPTCQRRPDAATVRAEALAFMAVVEAHYGQRPIVYTDPGFWEDNGVARLGAADLWLRSTRADPSGPYDGAPWTFWQYSATGLVPGIGTEVDLNAFAGSRAEWAAWLAARAR